MGELATIEDLKCELAIPETVTKLDDRLQKAIDSAEAEVLAYLCLDQFAPKSYTLTADIPCVGRRMEIIGVETLPIVSVTSVTNGTKVLGALDYVCRDGSIRICCGAWCCGCRAAEITLVAGFDTSVPRLNALCEAITSGIVDYAAIKYSSKPGLKSETIGRYKYERFAPGDQGAVNGPGHWPSSLSTALLPLWRATNAVRFRREC